MKTATSTPHRMDKRIEGIEPLLVPLTHIINYVGLSANTIKRMAANDPDNFPKLIRISHTKVLVDVQATADYLRSKAGNAPNPPRKRTAEEIEKYEAKAAAGGYAKTEEAVTQ